MHLVSSVGDEQTLTLKSEAAFEVVKWRRNGTEISGATGKTLEIESAGTYQALVKNAGGCLVETADFIVKAANATPVTITGPAAICAGEKKTLTLTSEAAFEVVRWRRNGTEITGVTGKTLEIEQLGTYKAIVRSAGGCLFETADFVVKESSATPVVISGPAVICSGEKKTLTLTSEAAFEVFGSSSVRHLQFPWIFLISRTCFPLLFRVTFSTWTTFDLMVLRSISFGSITSCGTRCKLSLSKIA